MQSAAATEQARSVDERSALRRLQNLAQDVLKICLVENNDGIVICSDALLYSAIHLLQQDDAQPSPALV